MFAGLNFTAPWILAGLAVLPAIWWLLRVTPPAPRRVSFPPLRLLRGLTATEEHAAGFGQGATHRARSGRRAVAAGSNPRRRRACKNAFLCKARRSLVQRRHRQ